MQKGFEGREIREAQSGILDATLRDLAYSAMAPRQDEPQVRRLHPSFRAHQVARPGCVEREGEAVAITRSMENAPAPRIIRNAVIASTSR